MYQILGVKNINYTNKQGRQVQGFELHLAEHPSYSTVDDGVGVCSVFAPLNIVRGVPHEGLYAGLCYQINRDTPRLVCVNIKSDVEEV